MSEVDTSKPVLVTGATGYIAGWIVKRLLQEGLTVHAAVRDPDNQRKLAHLDALAQQSPGSIRYFKADLLEDGSYAEAMAGCGIVFHTASPFTSNFTDPQRDLVDPAVLGTRNVVTQATRTQTVTRVVVTSSCAAIFGDARDLESAKGDKFTEEDWNTTSTLTHQSYSYSKVMAEREAWRIANEQEGFRLVTVNPSLVLGPSLGPAPTSESFALVGQLLDGTMKAGVPAFNIGVVDVRDVAEQHVRAGFFPDANGRYICSAEDSSLLGIANSISRNFGRTYPVPKKLLPKWFAWLVGPLVDKKLTRELVSRNVGFPWRADNSKAVRELNMSFRPLDESTRDMVEQMTSSAEAAQ